MSDDKEILKEVWDGKLPVCFKLSTDDCLATESDGLFFMIPRQSYFYLIKEKLERYFKEFLPSGTNLNDIWLEFNGIPLKWHYPVGLLFDLYAYNPKESFQNLPWNIHVHLDKYPDEIIQFSNKDSIEAFFIMTIKEADVLKHRGKVIHEMQKQQHKQLWYGFQNDKFDQFWSVNKKLMEPDETHYFRHVPFRVYLSDKSYIQKLFQPVNDDGEKRTLRDLLNCVFGDIKAYQGKLILIQGVSPSLDTSVQWLSEHLSYPDNFLHICIK